MSNYYLRNWEHIHQHTQPFYWTVFNHETAESTRFLYKHDATVYQKILPHATLYFHWYEDEFARLNVSIEPPESHAELCRQRAQELRDTYKYLRLSFSGGSDSLTALHSFVDNNIHLDEIVVVDYFDGSNLSDPMQSTSREIKLCALPHLKQIAHLIPITKITVVNTTAKDDDDMFIDYSDDPEKHPTFDTLEGELHFGIESWTVGKVMMQTYRENCCDIHGGSKVKLFKNKDKWYFYWVDGSMSDLNMCAAYPEDFFISRTIPNLYLKTVYLLKNYYISQNFDDATINKFHEHVENGPAYNFGLGRRTAQSLALYKTYHSSHNPLDWENHLISGWHSTLFFKNVVNTSEGDKWIKIYQRNIKSVIELARDEWNVDKLGNPVPAFGRKGHYSKFYCLNDGRAYDSVDAKK
jgi:hypothetical protein